MRKQIGKGSTFYDHKLIKELEQFPAPVRDLKENRHADDAVKYLGDRLRCMDEFKMSADVARHHVTRLYQRTDC